MSRAASLAISCCLCAHAMASPRSDPTEGRAVFTGATMPDLTSLDLNPAAMGLPDVKYDELYIAATLVVNHVAIDRSNLDVATGNLSPGAHVRDTELGEGGQLGYMGHVANDEF